MKFIIALTCFAALAFAQAPEGEEGVAATAPAGEKDVATTAPESEVKTYIRDLPADMLRDFQGLCFASTLCRVFEPSKTWDLAPFCGKATCIKDPVTFHLIERVQDCGPLPLDNPDCKVINEADKDKPFPACCPEFQCADGVELVFPTADDQASSQGSQ